MNHDYADPPFVRHEWYPDSYTYGTGTGWHGGSVDALDSGTAWVPPDSRWDPVEELAYLLQEAVPAEPAATVPPPRSDASPGVDFTDPMENLTRITAQLPRIPRSSPGHRKIRVRKSRLKWLQTGGFLIVAFVAAIVAMVSVFGGMAAYGPLQSIMSDTKSGTIPWWPLLVYGPWLAASLSILRTALHRRRAVHSWLIVLLFSVVAVLLCLAQAERTLTGIAGAVLPPVACLACFHQLVRQITLTRPPRQTTPRHRQ